MELVSYPAGAHVDTFYFNAKEGGIWDTQKFISDYEKGKNKETAFEMGQRFLYHIGYMPDSNQIYFGVLMSNCNGEVNLEDLVSASQPIQKDTSLQ
jgi:hypothetical protein